MNAADTPEAVNDDIGLSQRMAEASALLKADSFDAIDYINAVFPTESTLQSVPKVVTKLNARIMNLNEDLNDQVKSQVRAGAQGRQELEVAKECIAELFAKMKSIKEKAVQSEAQVQDMCRDIQSLDYAKRHLTASITTLKRLSMLVSSTNKLDEAVTQRDFQQCAGLLDAITQLAATFEDYRHVPRVEAALVDFEAASTRVKGLCMTTFDAYQESVEKQSENSAPLDCEPLAYACCALMTIDKTTKVRLSEWYIKKIVKAYDSLFFHGAKESSLSNTEMRFAWLKRKMRDFSRDYADIFPGDWHVEETMVATICARIHSALKALLEESQGGDVTVLLRILTHTLEFEQELQAKFEKERKQESGETVEEEDDDYVTSEDEEDDIGVNGTEAIKRKYKKFIRDQKREAAGLPPRKTRAEREKLRLEMQERRARGDMDAGGPAFLGIISPVFDPFLSFYVTREDENMREMMEKALIEETWEADGDGAQILRSSSDLFYYFKKTLKRVSTLTRRKTLFDLTKLYKKYLALYHSTIMNRLPRGGHLPTKGDWTIHLSPADYVQTCLILSTSDYCRETTGQLQSTIRNLIDTSFAEAVDFTEEEDFFGELATTSLKILVVASESEADGAMQSLAQNKWDKIEAVSGHLPFVAEFERACSLTTSIAKDNLPPLYFRFFCDKAAIALALRIQMAIERVKKVPEVGANQMLIDVKAMAKVLHSLPALLANGNIDSEIFIKESFLAKVHAQTDKFVSLVQCLLVPEQSLSDTYKTFFPQGNSADLIHIMDVRGMKRNNQNTVLEDYGDDVVVKTGVKKLLSKIG